LPTESVPPAPSRPSDAADNFDRPDRGRPRRESRDRDDDDGRRSRRDDDDDRPRRRSRRDDYDDEPRGPARTSGKAVASLILGIVSIPLPLCITSIFGIIYGIRGMNECTPRSGITGKGMAITGLILSIFTLMVGILIIPFALLVPAVQKVREAAARTQQINNMKQLSLAVHSAHDAWKSLPPASGSFGQASKKSYSLSVHLLPYIEQQPMYQNFAIPGQSMPSTALVPSFNAPLDFTTGDFIRVQNFAGNLRVFTDTGFQTQFDVDMPALGANQGFGSGTIANRFPDGTSQTILFATRNANNGSVGSGGNVNCSAYDALVGSNNSAFFGANPMTGFASATSAGGWQLNPNLAQTDCKFGALAHSFGVSGIQLGMADGSIHQTNVMVSPKTWNCAVQPNDAWPLGTDW
jgi:hypothetical protein